MTDRLRRLALIVVFCSLTSAAGAHELSPPFAVRVEGRGPAMILIPGFLSSGAVWDDVVAHYRSRSTCHVFTLPGFAGQPSIAAPILPRIRDEIVHYIRRQHLNRPVIVGHSLGGVLALWVAATAPELVGTIVSVEGVPFLPALTDPAATVESVRPQAAQMKNLFASLSTEQLAMQSRLTSATMISDRPPIEHTGRIYRMAI